MILSSYLSLFDSDKYQKIEPTVSSIQRKNGDPSQVISLLKNTISVVESDEFKEYSKTSNSPVECCKYYLKNALNLVENGHLLDWSNNNVNTSEYIMPYFVEITTFEDSVIPTKPLDISCEETLNIIILVLCCPDSKYLLNEIPFW